MLRVLEDAAEGPLVRRLSRLAKRLKLADAAPDLLLGARDELEFDLRDELPRYESASSSRVNQPAPCSSTTRARTRTAAQFEP
jgi:hypothetical protein